jgi:hypothetical protein
MQENLRRSLQRIGMIALGAVMLVALVASVNLTAPAAAQDFQPTPTPADPVWRAFSAVRAEVEEARNVDLTIVRAWTFEQTEWRVSIDSCRDDVLVNDQRPAYFGWNFTITDLGGTVHYARAAFDLSAIAVCDRQEQAAAGGTGGDTTVAPPPTNVVIGDFELGGHMSTFSSTGVQAMKTAGMTWAKKQLRYSPGMGTGQAQAWLSEAQANGFKLLLGVVGYPSDMANYDQYIQDFANYLGELAALGVHAIEVWNEPNIDREWPAGQINGGNYTRMLQAAYGAIKAKNSSTLVISGAPAPTGFFGAAGCTDAGCNDDTFMQQMAQSGAANYMDCIGLHYNEGIVSPDTNGGDPRGEYPTYYFGSMTARGYGLFGGRQVCYTELGYLSGDGFTTPIPAGFAWANNVTVEQQASWLATAAARAAQSGQVRMMIVWNINFTVWNSDPQAGYAIIRPDGSCPACNALGQVMSGS